MKYIFAILTNTFHNLDKYILLLCGTLTTRQRVEWAKVNTRCVFLPGMKQANNKRKQATQKVFTVFFISSSGDETDKQQTEQSTQERCLPFFPKSPYCVSLSDETHKSKGSTQKKQHIVLSVSDYSFAFNKPNTCNTRYTWRVYWHSILIYCLFSAARSK